MKTYFSLALIGAAAALPGDLTELKFDEWKEHHKLRFGSIQEDRLRASVFEDHRKIVIAHNARYENGEESYHLALNEFAHMPNEEFLELRTMPSWEAGTYGQEEQDPDFASEFSCPEKYTSTSHSSSWDGRSHKQVTMVKDQGSCGSCWTFGAGAAIEGAMCKAGRYNCNVWNGVSTQQLVDCASGNSALNPYDNMGCRGGFQSNALRYVYAFEHGIDSWDSYKYVGNDRGKCAYSKSKSVGTIKSCGRLGSAKNQNNMCSMIEKKGITTVAIDASGSSFQLYSGGLYTGGGCSSTRLNHAVTAVAFGTTSGKSSLTIKNSWGTRWGDKGYIHFARDGKTNTCGVYSEGQYAIY